jgi:ABC-type dipeptide/oligopeptide/nickel transport system permease component
VINFLISRVISCLLTLFFLSIIVFSMIHLAPGDPVSLILPLEATEQEVAEMRSALGLDKPVYLQYVIWLKKAVVLDFGKSIQSGVSAAEIFRDRLPASLELAFMAILLAVSFSIPLGIFAAVNRGSCWDFACSFVSLLGLSIPRFWIGIVLILFFSLGLGWFPALGREVGLIRGIGEIFEGNFHTFFKAIKSLILPSVALSTWSSAVFLKFTRASVLEEISKLYTKTAREKGMREWRVLLLHVLRNASIPIITIVGLSTGRLVGGAVIVEIVFAWPVVGQLLIQAFWARDYPLVQASLFMIGGIIMAIFIAMDIVYALIDPRIRTKDIQ